MRSFFSERMRIASPRLVDVALFVEDGGHDVTDPVIVRPGAARIVVRAMLSLRGRGSLDNSVSSTDVDMWGTSTSTDGNEWPRTGLLGIDVAAADDRRERSHAQSGWVAMPV